MKNDTNDDRFNFWTRRALLNALRDLAEAHTEGNHNLVLTLDESGWGTCPRHLVGEGDLMVLDDDGLLDATPNEDPEDYTEETFEGLVEWVENNVQGWVRMAVEEAGDEAEADEAGTAQWERRPVNLNATSEWLEVLYKILSNLKRA